MPGDGSGARDVRKLAGFAGRLISAATVVLAGTALAASPSASLSAKAPAATQLLAAAKSRGGAPVIITLAMPGGTSGDDAALRARVRSVVEPFVAEQFGKRQQVRTMPFLPMVATTVSAAELERIAADPRVTRIDADGISGVQ